MNRTKWDGPLTTSTSIGLLFYWLRWERDQRREWSSLTILHRFSADEAGETGGLRQFSIISLVALYAGTQGVGDVVREVVCNIIGQIIRWIEVVCNIVGQIIRWVEVELSWA